MQKYTITIAKYPTGRNKASVVLDQASLQVLRRFVGQKDFNRSEAAIATDFARLHFLLEKTVD